MKTQTLAERRQANWAKYPRTNPDLTAELTRKLDEAWADQRKRQARKHFGDATLIIKRARVEREIERLASSNGS